MANVKNSKAAEIRQLMIEWLQDDTQTLVVDEQHFPGIRGIRAKTLRERLEEQGYTPSTVMGAVSAAPGIDDRIKKAQVTPRMVYYYFDETPADAAIPAIINDTPAATAAPANNQANSLAATPEFSALTAQVQTVATDYNQLLQAAQTLRQRQRLADFELDFLESFAELNTEVLDLLQHLQHQTTIQTLRDHN